MKRGLIGLLVCLAVAAVVPWAAAEPADKPWEGVRTLFRSRLGSAEPKEKERAFECLRDRAEGEAFEELLGGYKKVRAEGDQVRNLQERVERDYEDLMNKLIALQAKSNQGELSPRDIEAFNKAEKKLAAQIDEQRRAAKNLENDWSRNRALLDSATAVASTILAAMKQEPVRQALANLRLVWLEGKDPEGPMRWMDTLAGAHSDEVTNELRRVLGDESILQKARVAALTALAERGEHKALEAMTALLKLPPEGFQLVTAAIAGLRRLHDKGAIVPLIEFLRREDLGRLREDARDALVSLTGQEHGPYFDPWDAWWKESEKAFAMPASPFQAPPLAPAKKSRTFYGIPTFSDRILYIVDLSESMSWALGKRGVPGGENAKIVSLREELIGAVGSLNEGATFNVIVFNHEVLAWGGQGVVTANDTSKRKLARWITEITPTGLTNIHDALEAGFNLILRTTGRPPFDTIFFLTDGKPTGGKITDPKLILEAVRDWNSVANTTIHVIGIGQGDDVDQHFLQELATIGKGKYIQRNN